MNFTKYNWLYVLISSLVIIPGLVFLFSFGLKLSIDFTGGSLFEFSSKERIKMNEIRQTLEKTRIPISSIQSTGNNSIILKMKTLSVAEKTKLKTQLSKRFQNIEEIRFENIGPTIGQELLQKTLIGAVLAIIGILLYITNAFKDVKFGTAAIVALIHDVLVVLGIFAILSKLFGIEVDTLFVTAILTTMSFSVHDTIVVFDRIRETQRLNPKADFQAIVNSALAETMTRSVNNSLTIVFMLLALFLLGGETTKWFVFALLLGTISGTYSSPFVATPIVYVWKTLEGTKK